MRKRHLSIGVPDVKIHRCAVCSSMIAFPNTRCLTCGADLVYDPAVADFVQEAPFCRNRAEINCNWAAASGEDSLCRSCAMTDVIPDTFHGENAQLWAEAELAKRRVLVSLARWGWFGPDDTGPLPRFHMLSEATSRGERNVVMAHDSGTITINVTEADVVELTERREQLGEKLRTMVAHFRHEIAHFLFERLSRDQQFLDEFRALMGDERDDYGAALARYYETGPDEGWEQTHITRYATSHPHEDWAETLTHLQHLTDITDSAVSVGWRSALLEDMAYDAYQEADTDRLLELGVHFSIAVNHINRSIGLGDIYPFVLNDGIRDKLKFVHRYIRRG